MSYVRAAPAALTTAASSIVDIGSNISAANAAAAASTTGVLPAAADEVSTQVAALFSTHAQGYQKLSAQLAAFHDSFVSTLCTSANSYTTAEANAVQNLVNSLNAPVENLLGHPLIGDTGSASNAVARAQSVFAGVLGSSTTAVTTTGSSLSALALQSTGGASGLPASSALLSPLANAAAAAPATSGGLGPAIENLYLEVEPWVAYGFNLLSYAAGWVPYVGVLAPQINFFYYLFEPIVQSVLFNTIDFIDGTVTFNQGLSNIWSATTASVNQFIDIEIAWVRSFFPPLPPIGTAS